MKQTILTTINSNIMKKLFLLIPALVLSLMVKAADQYPDPAVDNSLATAVSAVGDN